MKDSEKIATEFIEAVEGLPMDERLLYKLMLLSVCRSEKLGRFINAAFDYATSRQPLLLEMKGGGCYV